MEVPIDKRKWHLSALVLVAAVGLAVYLMIGRWRQSGFQWDLFLATFRQLDLRWLAASQILVLLTYYGRVLRWQVMMRPVCAHPSQWNLFSATVIGFTAVVLFGRAGELVRPYLISLKEKVPFSSQIAAWVLERIYDLLVVLLLFGCALARVRGLEAQVGPGLGWTLKFGGYVVGAACAVCLLVLLFVRQFSEQAQRRLMGALSFLPKKHLTRVEGLVTAFVQGLASTRSHSFVMLLILYTLLEWLIIAGCYICLFRAFPATAGFTLTDVLVFLGFVALGSSLQLPGIGGGVQIVAVIVLTELYNLRLESATSVAVMVWIITWIVVVPIGLAFGFKEGVDWTKMKQLRQEAEL